jgi:HSP20 family protein
MALIKRREEGPLGLLDQLHRDMDDLFFAPFARPFELLPDVATPRVDVSEDEKNIYVEADMPGLEQKDITVTLREDVLTISASREEQKEQKEKNYRTMERVSRSFRRQILLDKPVDKNKIDAQYKNGVLKLTLPKTAQVKESEYKIEVK